MYVLTLPRYTPEPKNTGQTLADELCIDTIQGEGILSKVTASAIQHEELDHLLGGIARADEVVRIRQKTSNCVYRTTTKPHSYLKIYATKEAAVQDVLFNALVAHPKDLQADHLGSIIELPRPILDGVARYQTTSVTQGTIENVPEEALDIKTHAVWWEERPPHMTLQNFIDITGGSNEAIHAIRSRFDTSVLSSLASLQKFALNQQPTMHQIGNIHGVDVFNAETPYTRPEPLAIIATEGAPLLQPEIQEQWNIVYGESITRVLRQAYMYKRDGKYLYRNIVIGDVTPTNIAITANNSKELQPAKRNVVQVFFPDAEFARMGIPEDVPRYFTYYKTRIDPKSCIRKSAGYMEAQAIHVHGKPFTRDEQLFAEQLVDYAIINQQVRVITRQVYEALSGKKTTQEFWHSFRAKKNNALGALNRIRKRKKIHGLITAKPEEHKQQIVQVMNLLEGATLPNTKHYALIAYRADFR